MKYFLYLIVLAVVAITLINCQELTVRNNYTGFRADEEIAIFSQKGHRFKLDGDLNSPVDRLNLIPGSYIIEYIDLYSNLRGAAYCEVKAGNHYAIKAQGFQDYPQYMKRVIKGICVAKSISE
ncbi:MAG: hypothetical protein H3C43_03525 [Leptonema sp. (in: Bacteria)]|nr:hypothetical protein [Leptonema sp. (in: bacteria)]